LRALDNFLKLYKLETNAKNKEVDTNKRFDFWYYALISCYKKILPKDIIATAKKRFKIDVNDVDNVNGKRKNYSIFKTNNEAVKKYLKIYGESNMNYTNIDKKILTKYEIQIKFLL